MPDWPKPDADAETTGETQAVITRRRPSDPDAATAPTTAPTLPNKNQNDNNNNNNSSASNPVAASPSNPPRGLGVPRASQQPPQRQPRVTGPHPPPQIAPQPQAPQQAMRNVPTPPTMLNPQPARPPATSSLPQSEQGLHASPRQLHREPMVTGPPAYQQHQHQQQQQQHSQQHHHDPSPPVGYSSPQQQPIHPPPPSTPSRLEEAPHSQWVTSFHFRRSRTYAFVVDRAGRPVEIGSGRFARVYLGQERWLESVTDLQRDVVIKMMHKNLGEDEAGRFRQEKELLERVQGHPNIVELLGSGECSDPRLPATIREQTEGDFMILEKLDMNLEERLKGSRDITAKEDLLAFDMHDRLLRVLEYMIPIASAVEYAHIVRNVCHRDINPANVLIGLPDPHLAGARMQVRLADFSVAKMSDGQGVTRFAIGVPGTMYFQSPEQETNLRELLVNVTQGSPEVEYFEDFYLNIAKNDTFAIFNRPDEYNVVHLDNVRKRIVLHAPYSARTETNIRARVQKSVGRPADIYALGGLFYYLISGAYGNPKVLYDTFHKFIEYERPDETNTIDAYLRHDYQTLQAMQSQRSPRSTAPDDAPANRFFSYKHYFDGNGELIHPAVMTIIARCMIRNKPDSYCQMHEVDTVGITNLVRNLTTLYSLYGIAGSPEHFPLRRETKSTGLAHYGAKTSGAIRRLYENYLLPLFEPRKKG